MNDLTSKERATVKRLREMLVAQLNDAEVGRVHCEIYRLEPETDAAADPRFLLMQILRDRELTPRPGDLFEMPKAVAERVVEDLFRGPIGGPPSRTEVEARTAASSFFSLFGQGARFYSTWNYTVDSSNRNLTYTGQPILENSVESGIFVVDSKHVACLLVGDED